MGEATELGWPLSALATAVQQLAVVSGLAGQRSPVVRPHATRSDSVDGGVERLTRALDFEAEPADVSYAQVDRTLHTAGPALLKVSSADGDFFLALLGSSGRTVRLLAPDGQRHRLPSATVAGWIRRHLEQPLDNQIDQLVANANVPAARRAAAKQALLRTRLAPQTAARCWLLRPRPEAPLRQHLRHARLPRRLLVFVLAYAGAALASVGAWWLIGAAALSGRFDPGTLLAWSFLLLSLVPLGLFARWAQGVFIVGVSGIIKQRLLAGALKIDPDDARHQGVGQHLARVLESESLEALTLAGGFYAVAGLFEFLLASLILVASADYTQVALLWLTGAALALVTTIYFRGREQWTAARLRLTHDLVERMVGHRTRLVQESHIGRHDDEDEALDRYVGLSKRMDRAAIVLSAMPRIWLIVGLGGLAPQFVTAVGSVGWLAAELGATLLAVGAFGKITTSLSALADAAISWKQVAPLVSALRRPEPAGHVNAAEPLVQSGSSRTGALINAQDLCYRFPDRAEPVLRGCDFRINSGDRIHLTGSSGAGKSTLISLLTALRSPDSGLLLLDGLDRATLGPRGWRRRIAAAPQFQDNYLFNDTLAFNLLMGRRWPPIEDDVRWADVVCRRLGLGELIDRMPGGLFQLVGETGWQLSHGERTRVYMARALLQGADLVVLDESFAELDPESLERCLPAAADLARSLLVVAHA